MFTLRGPSEVFASPVITFGFDSLNNAGGGDLFLAKLNDNITGIGEFSIFTGLALFPDPASDRITIASPPGAAVGRVTVFNRGGQQCLPQDITGTATRLDISALPPGLYFARLVSSQRVKVGKFMKK